MVSAVGPRPGLSSVGPLGFSLSCTSSSLVSFPSSSRKRQSAAAKTSTATNPGTENLFETAPFGAGASKGDPDTEEEGEAAGEDDGGEGGDLDFDADLMESLDGADFVLEKKPCYVETFGQNAVVVLAGFYWLLYWILLSSIQEAKSEKPV
ncbi:hypothetical protein GBA52_020504 [Prunus armeniaca]|nr:hypothetical protein GBA52_020504 [Prunus armeniaca]